MCLVGALAAVKGCCFTNDYQFSWINTEAHAYALSAVPQRELIFKKKQNYKLPSNIWKKTHSKWIDKISSTVLLNSSDRKEP